MRFVMGFVQLWMSLAVSFVPAVAQDPPVKMGLWETTAHIETTVDGDFATVLKNRGQSLPAPTTLRTRSCRQRSEWEKNLADAERGPQGCVLLHRSSTAQSFSTSHSCQEKGLHVIVDGAVSWPSKEHFELVFRTTTTQEGQLGKRVYSMTTSGRFISSDCGKLRPGERVVVK